MLRHWFSNDIKTTSTKGKEMQQPVLLAADRLAILLDMVHRRLLAPIELKADLARKSKHHFQSAGHLLYEDYAYESSQHLC